MERMMSKLLISRDRVSAREKKTSSQRDSQAPELFA